MLAEEYDAEVYAQSVRDGWLHKSVIPSSGGCCIGVWLPEFEHQTPQIGCPPKGVVKILRGRGKKWASCGFSASGGMRMLYPEEAMYLIDAANMVLVRDVDLSPSFVNDVVDEVRRWRRECSPRKRKRKWIPAPCSDSNSDIEDADTKIVVVEDDGDAVIADEDVAAVPSMSGDGSSSRGKKRIRNDDVVVCDGGGDGAGGDGGGGGVGAGGGDGDVVGVVVRKKKKRKKLYIPVSDDEDTTPAAPSPWTDQQHQLTMSPSEALKLLCMGGGGWGAFMLYRQLRECCIVDNQKIV